MELPPLHHSTCACRPSSLMKCGRVKKTGSFGDRRPTIGPLGNRTLSPKLKSFVCLLYASLQDSTRVSRLYSRPHDWFLRLWEVHDMCRLCKHYAAFCSILQQLARILYTLCSSEHTTVNRLCTLCSKWCTTSMKMWQESSHVANRVTSDYFFDFHN